MNSKYTICVIGAYFGKFPAYFNLWIKSCELNRNIDFLIISDNTFDELPTNVHSVKMTLDEMRRLADEKLGLKTALSIPYKCCDFKPVYGIIFEDYIKDYDFWGHCDFDLVFGDIRAFITDDVLMSNDKIFSLGHLTLYRNIEECKNRYKEYGSQCGDYRHVFTNVKSFAFDEIGGINSIYKQNGFSMYDKRSFADISSVYKRFRLALNDKNYRYQAFYWQNGRAFRAFYENGSVKTEEFAYIHFKQRGFTKTVKEDKGFYICPDGFVIKTNDEVPTIEQIKKINPYHAFRETCETVTIIIGDALKPILYRVYRTFLKKSDNF